MPAILRRRDRLLVDAEEPELVDHDATRQLAGDVAAVTPPAPSGRDGEIAAVT